jgi:hypothetical protein
MPKFRVGDIVSHTKDISGESGDIYELTAMIVALSITEPKKSKQKKIVYYIAWEPFPERVIECSESDLKRAKGPVGLSLKRSINKLRDVTYQMSMHPDALKAEDSWIYRGH